MSDFHLFKEAINVQFEKMSAGELFSTAATKDGLWETYLGSFEPGTNPIFRERTEHDCNCCKQFIRAGGNVVAFIDDEIVSIWDVQVGGIYQPVADALSAYVKSCRITDVYRHYENNLGTDHTNELMESGVHVWKHFHYRLPSKFVMKAHEMPTFLGSIRTNKEVLERGLKEISRDSYDIVIELIEQKSLYKGDEYLSSIKSFLSMKIDFDAVANKEKFLWDMSQTTQAKAKFRNSVIGTLLVDISNGEDLEVAVKKFESKVAPHNYKRSKSLITPRMREVAAKRVSELGLEDSLHRRPAVIDDISINNVLWADVSAKKSMGVFDVLDGKMKSNIPNLDKVEEVSIDTFMESILPKANSIEVLVENSHVSNLMSLVSPEYKDSIGLFKWNNNFSWAYNGDITDATMQRVIDAGGRVDGVMRFTHSWNHNGDNQSLMDLHVFLPTHESKHEHNNISHDYYGNNQRVGWNNRQHSATKGSQDVDFTSAPGSAVPIENITFPSIEYMPEGEYVFAIHNWSLRNPTRSGFKAQVALFDKVYDYEYSDALKNKEWVEVARATLKNGAFSIQHTLKPANASKEIWNIHTQDFHKVSVVMNSPNHWDDQTIGNKHWFFMLENAKNPEPIRGFFNEFLRDDLHNDRKVFEVLGANLKAQPTDNQLSGLGFSSTQRNHLICRVRGSFNRLIKINF